MMVSQPSPIKVLNVHLHPVSYSQALELIAHYMTEERLHQVATVNPEFVMMAQKDEEFRMLLNEADLCIADGIGLILASRWMKQPLPERVAGSDLVFDLASAASSRGWRVFLLGAQPGVAEAAAQILEDKYEGLTIAGSYAGSPDIGENDSIVQQINDSGADMLFVAYGAPHQDKWIKRNWLALPNIRVAMGVGGSLDFITGRAVRAPEWIQRLGMEWLYRLFKEPWRWRRMLALPKFALMVLFRGR